MRRFTRVTAPAVCALVLSDLTFAQRGTGDWMTTGFDSQRSHWVRSDAKISVERVSKPGFELVWKIKPENTARQLNSIQPPSLLDFFIGHRGFRSLAFFGLSNDRVVGVDIDLAKTEWEKNLASGTVAPGNGTPECPGGLTAAVTRPTSSAYPPIPLTRGGPGRGTPPKSGVGEPHEGAVTLKAVRPPQPPRPQQPKPTPGAAAADNPFAPRVQYAVALSSDGKLHMMWVSNGNETAAGIPFIPAGANAQGLVSYGGHMYASTTGGCPGIDSGVWAINMTSKQVSKWKSPGKGIAGTAGQAAGPDGTVFVSGGNGELTALAPMTLEPLRSYKTGGVELTSSPVVFEFKGKDLVAVTSADGRLHLVDGASMSSALDKSDVFAVPGYNSGALASWLDTAGVRWILAPSGNAIQAFKVVEKNGNPALEKSWTSRELVSPLTPVIVNDVVFALSSGEHRDSKLSAAQRAQRSTPAVLYALDAISGKEIWNSGKTITTFVHSGALAAGGSRVYVGGYDGTQYAFSFPIEH
jgi:outer membrane protein assembly factor BamB